MVKSEGVYRHRNITLVPYPNQVVLAVSYARFEEEGLLDVIYHEWKPDLLWFVSNCLKPETATLAFHVKHNGGVELAGLAWINRADTVGGTLKRAEVGAGFFRSFHGTTYPMRCIQMAVEWVFEDFGVDSIWGITPAPNAGMVNLMRGIGFHIVGPVLDFTLYAGVPANVYLSSMTKTLWRQTVAQKKPFR